MDDRFLYAGLIRLHVLHHAAKEPVYGLAMIEELGRHGYKLAPARSIQSCTGSRRRGT
jgi:PadR family transcriptional regulator, regulatory protein PadR